MSSRLTKVSSKQHGKFILKISILLAVLAAGWYCFFSMDGVYQRSVESVANTEWISWEEGSLYFTDYQAKLVTDTSTSTYNYEEREGTVWMRSEFEGDQIVLVRFKDTRMITSDGKVVFYLKSADKAEESSDG